MTYLSQVYLDESKEGVKVDSGLHGAEFLFSLGHHDLSHSVLLHLVK